MKTLIISFLFFITVSGCQNAESRYDSGYDDGYATGYNTTCQIRATLVEGDWNDKNYMLGYRDGYAAGALDCKQNN